MDILKIKKLDNAELIEVEFIGTNKTLTSMLYTAMVGSDILAEIVINAVTSYSSDIIEAEEKARLN
jgi:hypothetical protein